MPTIHLGMEISEKLLHHVWKYKLLRKDTFTSINNEDISILHVGEHNHDAGPDFFNCKIKLDTQIWIGNMEIHVKTSDWIKHKHEKDEAYNNVILHVVYENDLPQNKQPIKNVPVIELKQLLSKSIIEKFEYFQRNESELPCGRQIKYVPDFTISAWLQRLLIQRLENKMYDIEKIFKFSNSDYQETCYQLFASNFGFKINAEPFMLLARHTPLALLLKHKTNLTQIEALLFGQAGFLNEDNNHPYYLMLQNEYAFLSYKYQLKPLNKSIWKYLRLRPANFPTLRIAQFSAFIHQSEHLFSKVLDINTIQDVFELFNVCASPYWHFHYSFTINASQGQAKLGISSIENIAINTIAPLHFFYGRQKSESKFENKALELLEQIHPEKNKLISGFSEFGVYPKNAIDSQGMIQLHHQYCSQKKCLDCSIGHTILNQS
jgi:hypothetical protein